MMIVCMVSGDGNVVFDTTASNKNQKYQLFKNKEDQYWLDNRKYKYKGEESRKTDTYFVDTILIRKQATEIRGRIMVNTKTKTRKSKIIQIEMKLKSISYMIASINHTQKDTIKNIYSSSCGIFLFFTSTSMLTGDK